MADYTLADAVADRDEAYRLLHAAQARIEEADERFDQATLVYSVQYQLPDGRWHVWDYETHSAEHGAYLLQKARDDEFDSTVVYRLAVQTRAPWRPVSVP